MTETSPAVLTLDREDAARKAGSSGKPVLHTEVRIVRPDGTDAEVGELGELWVKGPNITPGYWNRPDANASSFTDGWLHTGDAARIDEDGFYYIVDRWKDMYISGGENVYPAEVENVLHQLTAIAEAAVIGIPSEQWGEIGMAIVAVKPGHSLTEAEIHAHCAANLARFKCPRLIRFVDALPRNATGKIHKPTLRKNFGSPDAIDQLKSAVRKLHHPFRNSIVDFHPMNKRVLSMKNKKLSLLGSSLISLAAATALTVLATQGALAQKKYDTGATDTEIKIGNVEAYSGPASAYGVIGKTEDAYFKMVNDARRRERPQDQLHLL